MIRTTQFTMSGSTQLLASAQNATAANPKTVLIQNQDGTNAVAIGGINRGGPGVDNIGGAAYTLTTTNGFRIAANSSISLTLGPGDSVYGIAVAGGPVVVVLEMQTN